MKQKKRKGRSVQQLLGIQTFTKYGLMTDNGELLFYRVAPTNISVLSAANIEIKIRHLQMVLSAIPDIEIIWASALLTVSVLSRATAGSIQKPRASAMPSTVCLTSPPSR